MQHKQHATTANTLEPHATRFIFDGLLLTYYNVLYITYYYIQQYYETIQHITAREHSRRPTNKQGITQAREQDNARLIAQQDC